MLHLFNKIYVKPDTNFVKSGDLIIMSPVVAILPTDEFLQFIMSVDLGKIHLSGASYDDIISQLGSEDAFFQYLVNFDHTKRLTIYATDDDLIRIMLKWYKALLRNADTITAFRVIITIFKRFELLFGYPYNPQVKLSDAHAAHYRRLGQKLPSLNQFVKMWEDTVPYDFSSKGYQYFADRCGLELQLASYFATDNSAFTEILTNKIVPMIRKFQINLMLDLREMTINRLASLPDYDIHTQTVQDWVDLHPDYQFLTDNQFLPDQYLHIEQTYGYDMLRRVFEEQIARTGYEIPNGLFDYISLFKPDLSLEDVLNLELGAHNLRVQLGSWEYGNLINIYLLEYILELKRADNIEQLQKLSVI